MKPLTLIVLALVVLASACTAAEKQDAVPQTTLPSDTQETPIAPTEPTQESSYKISDSDMTSSQDSDVPLSSEPDIQSV